MYKVNLAKEDKSKKLTKGDELENVEMKNSAEEPPEDGWLSKIWNSASTVGIRIVYKALQLFYVAQAPDCPKKVKVGIFTALGYILPVDLIPYFTPIAGYADEATVTGMALLLAQIFINDDVKAKARKKIQDWFGAEAVEKLNSSDTKKPE